MQNNLPEVWDTVKGLASNDRGNVFEKGFLFPRINEKRIDAQKEVLLRTLECNEKIKLAEMNIMLEQIKCSHETNKLKYETLKDIFQILKDSGYHNFDGDNSNGNSIISELGDVISRLVN